MLPVKRWFKPRRLRASMLLFTKFRLKFRLLLVTKFRFVRLCRLESACRFEKRASGRLNPGRVLIGRLLAKAEPLMPRRLISAGRLKLGPLTLVAFATLGRPTCVCGAWLTKARFAPADGARPP